MSGAPQAVDPACYSAIYRSFCIADKKMNINSISQIQKACKRKHYALLGLPAKALIADNETSNLSIFHNIP